MRPFARMTVTMCLLGLGATTSPACSSTTAGGRCESAVYIVPFAEQVELSVRVATLLLRLHQQQLVGSGIARPTLVKLHAVLHRQVKVSNVVFLAAFSKTHCQRAVLLLRSG